MKKGHIGIELGTRYLRICTKEKEQFLRMNNMAALDHGGRIVRIGNDAYSVYEKEPKSIQLVSPMSGGVISDYTNMRRMLQGIMRKYFRHFRKYSIYTAVPSDITNVEKRAFYDLMSECCTRVRKITLLPKPVLCAGGCGMDLGKACGNMIVDMGADTTEISVVSLGGIVKSRLLRFGGNQIDQWVMFQMKRKYHLNIGRKTAEYLKIQYSKSSDEIKQKIKGRDFITGLPKEIQVSVSVPEEKVKAYIYRVITEVKAMLETVLPEVASDIMMQGIYLAGGGASFRKIPVWMEEELGIPVHVAKQPEDSVIRGLKAQMSESKE